MLDERGGYEETIVDKITARAEIERKIEAVLSEVDFEDVDVEDTEFAEMARESVELLAGVLYGDYKRLRF